MNSCFICKQAYDAVENIPTLCTCGHTFCLPCCRSSRVQGYFTCPKDQKSYLLPIEELKTNYSMIDLIQTTKKCSVYCCNGHELVPELSSGSKKCSICKKNSEKYHLCVLCLYQVCENCLDWLVSSKINPQQMVCFRNHPLRITENVEEYYKIAGVNKKQVGKFLCDGCLTWKKGDSAMCRECRVDYCQECLEKYERIMENIEVLMCDKKNYKGFFGIIGKVSGNFEVCSNRLAWRPDEIHFSCAECRQKFNKSGCFVCRTCEQRICIPCMYAKLY